jgi:hypothetical protein
MAKRGRPKGAKNIGTANGTREAAVLVKFGDPELLKRIEELAREEERSVPAMIRFLCRRGLKHYESEQP